MISKRIIRSFTRRWHCDGGYREVLTLAIPLILSTGSWSIQHFVDRMFLTWYSPEAIAAALPAGILNFTIMSLFIGTASYVSVFVAQYYGAGRFDKIGPAIWQGVYIAIIAGVVHLLLIHLARPIFGFVGHGPVVQAYEVVYFQILCLGAFPMVASSAMAGFFSGLGRPWPVMWVNISATAVNLAADYALIFGNWGFPELGVKGAGIATVVAVCFSFLAYLTLFFLRSHDRRYHILRGWPFEKFLFARLVRFGFPSGVQFFLDVAASTVFILLVGRLGTVFLAATNIALNINTLAFMPMIGFGIATSVLVGQHLGKDSPDIAERSAYSSFHLTFIYMASIAAAFVFVPDLFLKPFTIYADPASLAPIRDITVVLLRFVALFSLFDTMNIIFASAIKGAGDTRYVMYMIVVVSSLVLVIPCYIALEVLNYGIYVAWAIASTYIITLSFSFFIRFYGGKWKSMRVIEEGLPTIPPIFPETHTPDYEPYDIQ
ncbi:MAG: MATE family efflux transporter [Thermodesulfobacteriota bacterium]|nr:MATE family efflux transporter [Thermodesulfobacteriota bacterium]